MRGHAAALALSLLTGCSGPVRRNEPLRVEGLHAGAARCSALVAHLQDGRLVAFRAWRHVEGESTLTGSGTRWGDDRREPIDGPQAVEVRDVRMFECLSVEGPRYDVVAVASAAFVVLVGLSVAAGEP